MSKSKPVKRKYKRKYKRNKKPTKKEIYNITKRLYYLLRSHPENIEFKKLSGGYFGFYTPGTEEITIDYRRAIVPTLVHEAIHKWHNDWSETKVCIEERRTMNALTPRQTQNIIKALAKTF